MSAEIRFSLKLQKLAAVAAVPPNIGELRITSNVASMGRIGLRISVGTVHNILYRIGTGLEPSSREILERIRKAYVLHIDETSLSLNGKLVWIWIFFNPETGDVYYTIRRSRGGDVLAEVLGGSWEGRIVCDGLSPYKKYRIQRVLGAHHKRDQAHQRREPGLSRGADSAGRAQGDTQDWARGDRFPAGKAPCAQPVAQASEKAH